MRRLLVLLIALASTPVKANPYLEELILAAKAMNLQDSPDWHALMHYKKQGGVFGLRSLADDKRFFNSPSGKTDPQAELEATLAAFFSEEQETDKTQNPQCRFIARYQWLKARLAFDPDQLPEQPCTRFRNWRASLDPGRVTLVFASAYLNNPASAYGHTLLRVDRNGQEDNTSLLAYAISYAARADDANALIFGIKGMFGGYDGTYAMSPYYVKVSEYNDFENRDLWEYELELTQSEIDLIIMHVWELGPIAFDYFFFDENCAYQLLLLLDAARPALGLADKFPLWAIPADTVRAVTETPGLVRRVTYRPSRSTVLRTRASALKDAEVDLSRKLAEGSVEPEAIKSMAPSTPKGAILDLAYDFLEYRRERGEIKDANVGNRLRELLSARSKLDDPADLGIPTPTVRPDQGHRSARIGFGLGTLDGNAFQELRLRPAYHDLMDPQQGYLPGSRIDFFNTVLRHHNVTGKTSLERFDLAHVTSLSARDRLIKPISWSANFGADRLRREDGTEGLRGRITVMGGHTYRASECCMWNAMLGVDAQGSRRLDAGYALGPGVQLSAYLDPSPTWRMGLSAQQFRYVAGDHHSAREIKLESRITLSPAWALRLEVGEQREFGASSTTLSISVNHYF